MIVFKVAPDYTTAQHDDQILTEWIGLSLEKFQAAMRRPPDSTESYTVPGADGPREITEYRWGDK